MWRKNGSAPSAWTGTSISYCHWVLLFLVFWHSDSDVGLNHWVPLFSGFQIQNPASLLVFLGENLHVEGYTALFLWMSHLFLSNVLMYLSNLLIPSLEGTVLFLHRLNSAFQYLVSECFYAATTSPFQWSFVALYLSSCHSVTGVKYLKLMDFLSVEILYTSWRQVLFKNHTLFPSICDKCIPNTVIREVGCERENDMRN